MINPAKPLENERYEAFAVHYAVNGNAAKAWLACGGDNPDTANVQGSKWVKKGGIKERIAWLKTEAERKQKKMDDKTNAPILLTIMRKRTLLASIAETGGRDADRISAIKLDNDLAGDGSEAKANDALSALAQAELDSIFGKA